MSDFNQNKKIKFLPLPYIGMFDLDLIYQTSDVELLYQILYKVNEIAQSQNIIIDNFEKILNWAQNQIETYTKEQLEEWLNDGTLRNQINNLLKIATVYNTTQELINSNSLQNGMKCITYGYKILNDGGGCKFIITDTVLNTDFYFETNTQGLYAVMIIDNSEYNLIACGCDYTGIEDSSVIINKLVNLSYLNGYKIFVPIGNFLINNTIRLNKPICIYGVENSTTFGRTNNVPTSRLINGINNGVCLLLSNNEPFDITTSNLVHDIVIKNIEIDTIDDNLAFNYSACAICMNSYDCVIKNVKIKGNVVSIFLGGSYKNIIDNCILTITQWGIYSRNSNSNNTISNIWVQYSGNITSALQVNNSYILTNLGNFIETTKICGLILVDSSIRVENFYVEGVSIGIYTYNLCVFYGKYVGIENCTDYYFYQDGSLNPSFIYCDNLALFTNTEEQYQNYTLCNMKYNSSLYLNIVSNISASSINHKELTYNTHLELNIKNVPSLYLPVSITNINGSANENNKVYYVNGNQVKYHLIYNNGNINNAIVTRPLNYINEPLKHIGYLIGTSDTQYAITELFMLTEYGQIVNKTLDPVNSDFYMLLLDFTVEYNNNGGN